MKDKIKYFELNQDDINNLEIFFKELLSFDPSHGKILYLSIILNDFLEYNVELGNYSSSELFNSIFSLKTLIFDDVIKSELDFLRL